jgi:hypothetical protein
MSPRIPGATYANVTATVALVLAMGGTSYAVAKLPKNSVTSAQVRDRSLRAVDLGAGVIPSSARGPRGQEGPAGPVGPAGVKGDPGPSDVVIAPQASSVALASTAETRTLVRRIDNLGAGAWVLRFNASAHNPGGGMHVYCHLRINGTDTAMRVAVVGTTANATQEVELPIETAVERPAPFDVTVECRHTQPGDITIALPQLIAMQVSRVRAVP